MTPGKISTLWSSFNENSRIHLLFLPLINYHKCFPTQEQLNQQSEGPVMLLKHLKRITVLLFCSYENCHWSIGEWLVAWLHIWNLSIPISFAGRWTQSDCEWKSPLVGLSSGRAPACSHKPFKTCALNQRLTCHSASATWTHRSPGHSKAMGESNSDPLKGSVQKGHPEACAAPLGLLEVTEWTSHCSKSSVTAA